MPSGIPNKNNSLEKLNPKLSKEWHPTKNGALTPSDVLAGSKKKVWWKCPKGSDHEWNSATIGDRNRGSGCPFCSGYKVSITNSLKTISPNIAKQWHPTKNGALTPSDVVAGSHKKVWWKCPKGPDHEWQTQIDYRAFQNKNCPFCSNRRASVTNRLDILEKQIAKQWHPKKNGKYKPREFSVSSTKKVWWKCPKGPDHEWQAPIDSRTKYGKYGCPFCVNKKVSVTNSLEKLYPNIAKQWHPKKNGKLLPSLVTYSNGKSVWWKCPKGPDHEWQTSPFNRTRTKHAACPFCTNSLVSVTNSLEKLYPKIAKEWHPKKNKNIKPSQITYGSNSKVWWKCPKGSDHEWEAQVYERTKGKTGCPYCAGQKVSVTNNLEIKNPDIAKQWHPIKNGDLKPRNVIAGGHKMIWFICPNGPDHEWKADLSSRVKNNRGCPFCSGSMVSKTNSLKTISPNIAKEWHPTKNGKLKPEDVVNGTHRKAWWKCSNFPSHIWEASIGSRSNNGRGCPYCTLTPRSSLEIKLAFELYGLINFDINEHKLKIKDKIIDVDILIRELKTVIEYDGSYWHLNKIEKDKAKTKLLKNNGWKVIRIREHPLEKISINDILVPVNCETKIVANLTILKLEEILKMKIPGSKKYINSSKLKNEKLSSKAIKDYLKESSRNKNIKI
jgi:hypothetical protein